MKDWLVLLLRKPAWLEGYAAMALFTAIAAILFFWDPLFTWSAEKLLAGGDIATQFAPWPTFLFDSLRQYGELPLWNPYVFSGVPFAANPQTMMFYPFTYLGLLMPLTRAMALTLAIHVWLAGMGMYGWLRALGAAHAGAFLAGAAFAFTGTYSLRLGVGQYNVALQLAWWPLSLWAMQTAFARRSWCWAIFCGVPLAMGLLSSHATTFLLFYVTLGAYTLFEAVTAYKQNGRWDDGARVLGMMAVAVVMSVALAAVQYLPFFFSSRLSTRVTAPSLDFSSSFSVPIGHLITLIVPNFFGEVIRTGSWSVMGQQEITHYVGVLIFLLALVGVRLTHNRRLLFFLALGLGALVLQLGPEGVLYTFFYRFVPGVAAMRAPGRAGLIYTFAVVTAAGLVWSELERASQDAVQHLLGIFDRAFVWVVSIVTISASLVAFIFYAAFKTANVAWTWHLGGQLTQFLVLFWAVMALFAALKNRSLSPRAISVLAVAILMFDLWSYGFKSIRPGSDPQAPLWGNIANFMRTKPGYRVAAEGDLEFVQNNGPLVYRIRGHYGYDSLVLARYQALLDSAGDYFDPVYDMLNIRYVVTPKPLEFKEGSPKLPVSFEQEGLWIYRRPSSLPRAFIVHDAQIVRGDAEARAALHAAGFEISRTATLPAALPCSLEPLAVPAEETAQVVGESPNRLELTTRSASAGLLVLSEVDYPGWQVKVDGQPAQVLGADTVLRAVCLPAGSHTVRFEFAPRDLMIGAIISCLALVVVTGACIGWLISARRRKGS